MADNMDEPKPDPWDGLGFDIWYAEYY